MTAIPKDLEQFFLTKRVIQPSIKAQKQFAHNCESEQAEPAPGPTAGERLTKITLIGIMSACVVYFGRKQQRDMSPFDYAVLALSAARLGRMTAHELVMEPIRAPLAQVEEHYYSGETTEPKYKTGPLHSLGQLITCPVCAGTWWAAALSFGLRIPALAGPVKLFMQIQAAVGAAELIHELIEVCCWSAAVARRHAGRGKR